jgi:hypothetical protein
MAFVELRSRRPDAWHEQEFTKLEAEIPLTALGVALPMTEIYRDVFPTS